MGDLVLARFYPILDAGVAGDGLLALCEAVLAAGAPWMQLRAKELPASAFVALARELAGRAHARGARLIVNDRADVALASGADGVHVGQGDLPVAAVRRIAGRRLVVGVSTHTVEEAVAAAASGADYIGFGPMFATASKPDALTPRPPALLRAARAAVSVPIVAIGGIEEEDAAGVLAAGADAIAMIGALARAADPRALTERLLRREA